MDLTWLWPFPTRDPKQIKRTDQGLDLAGEPGGPILAVASGTVGVASDPSGFGPDYPTLALDQQPAGAPSRTLYYGHTDVARQLIGQHVNAGDVIGSTAPLGHNSPPGWLEIGFGRDNAPGSPATPGAGATEGGQFITNLLESGSSAAGPAAGVPSGSGGSGSSGSSSGSPFAGAGQVALELALGAAGVLLLILGAKRFTGGMAT